MTKMHFLGKLRAILSLCCALLLFAGMVFPMLKMPAKAYTLHSVDSITYSFDGSDIKVNTSVDGVRVS